MDRKYMDNKMIKHGVDSEEERFLREQLVWVKERMDMLDLIEAKLKQVRILALYVVEHTLNEQEIAQVQSEVDQLLREIILLHQEDNVCH